MPSISLPSLCFLRAPFYSLVCQIAPARYGSALRIPLLHVKTYSHHKHVIIFLHHFLGLPVYNHAIELAHTRPFAWLEGISDGARLLRDVRPSGVFSDSMFRDSPEPEARSKVKPDATVLARSPIRRARHLRAPRLRGRALSPTTGTLVAVPVPTLRRSHAQEIDPQSLRDWVS